MTFASFETTPNESANAGANVNPVAPPAPSAVPSYPSLAPTPFSLKVSYGNEIRRASCPAPTFAALVEVVTKLFEGIDPAAIVLKYQDEDGDKITVSSDAEVKEAIRLSKDAKKIIRVFVESNKPQADVEMDGAQDWRTLHAGFRAAAFGGRGGFAGRGGFFGGRGGFPHHGPHGRGFPHAHPHHGPYPHVHPHPHPHPPPGFFGSIARCAAQAGPHGSPGFFKPAFAAAAAGSASAPASPADAPRPAASPNAPDAPAAAAAPVNTAAIRDAFHMVAAAQAGGCPEMDFQGMEGRHMFKAFKRSLKDHKGQMKEQLEEMKANAQTKEDREAIKAFKEHMKTEMKDAWKEIKKAQKEDKHEGKREKKERKHGGRHGGDDEERFMARHVADVTIPDNSELPADSPVVKTWRLRNPGTAAWPADSQLVFVSRHGDNLNGPEKVPVGAVAPGAEVEVSVPFITPAQPGRYVGYYRMATAEGVKFGQRVWVSFLIPAPAAAAGAPADAAAMDQ